MRFSISVFAAVMHLIFLPFAHATFHLYDFTEVYSNADGSIQFIEFSTTSNNQHLLSGHSVTSNANEFEFATNLSSSQTANTSFLMATSGFAALPGAVAPDFVIPDNFFSIDSDILTLVGGQFPGISWSSGGLPTDGINSLNRAINGGTVTSVATNSPTNFAGQTGSIDLSVGGEEPTEIFVDFSAAGGGDGTMESPFNTFAAAVDAVPDTGTIFITASHSDETIFVDVTKTFFVEAVGGSATIGPAPAPPPNGFRSRNTRR